MSTQLPNKLKEPLLLALAQFLQTLLSYFPFLSPLLSLLSSFLPLPLLSPPAPLPPSATYDPSAFRTAGRFEWRNWAKIQSARPEYFHVVTHENEIRAVLEFVRQRGESVRVVGCGHSPSDIAVNRQHMLSLEHYNQLLHLDLERKQVTVQSGISITRLNELLDEHGLALPTLGSISDQTLGGTLGTGTHGTGAQVHILSAYVTALTLLDASGTIHSCSSSVNSDIFNAARVNLGCLGVVSTITIQCVDAFDLIEDSVSQKLTTVLGQLDDVVKSADFVRVHWFPYTDQAIVTKMMKQPPAYSPAERKRVEAAAARSISGRVRFHWDRFFTFHLCEFLFFLSLFKPRLVRHINRFYQWALYSRPVRRVDRSDKIFNFDCLFKQYVTEWTIPFERTQAAVLELSDWIATEKIAAHFPVEIRFIEADTDMWLSPAYHQRVTYINIVAYRPYGFDVNYHKFFDGFEVIMKKHSGKPHWAKNFVLKTEKLAQMYEKWGDFGRMRERLDPKGMFRNDYIDRLFPRRTA